MIQRNLIALFGSIALMAIAFVALSRTDTSTTVTMTTPTGEVRDNTPLMLYCAASNRAVMEAIRVDYEQEFSRPIQIQYGPSQTLLSSLQVSDEGDLFLPADDSFLTLAKQTEDVREILPIAKMHPVIAVLKGNPKGIHDFKDLLRDDVRLVQANSDAAAIGKVVRQTLAASGQWDELDQHTEAYRPTVNDVANDLITGAADAAIVYDAILSTYLDLIAVEIPEFRDAVSPVSIGVLRSSAQPAAALHFARYVSARDRGQKRYQEYGFTLAPGDVWEDVPELSVFAGSMLRPAIETTIREFELREGVRVSRIYNGCGILVAQMKAGQVPDAYFACDTEFMNQVPDLFPEPVDVSENELVIVVHKGNPHAIANLADLGNQGLRVGVGHEKQCAMGWLTQNTFRESGVQETVMKNVTVQSPTGDMLVNQILTGSLDAAVVYLSNAAGAGEKLDAIQIQGLQCSVATQPFAISVDSPHAQTASRLFEHILTTESRQTFTDEGFRWKFDPSRKHPLLNRL